jgi:hypothetical protein
MTYLGFDLAFHRSFVACLEFSFEGGPSVEWPLAGSRYPYRRLGWEDDWQDYATHRPWDPSASGRRLKKLQRGELAAWHGNKKSPCALVLLTDDNQAPWTGVDFGDGTPPADFSGFMWAYRRDLRQRHRRLTLVRAGGMMLAPGVLVYAGWPPGVGPGPHPPTGTR